MTATPDKSPQLLKLLLVASIVLPLSVLLAGAHLAYRGELEDSVRKLSRSVDILHEHALKVFETIDLAALQVDQILGSLSDEQIRARESDLNRPIKALSDSMPQIQDIWVLDAAGKPLVSANVFPLPPQLDLSDRNYFRVHLDGTVPRGTFYVSSLLKGRVQDVVFFQTSRARERGVSGGFAGVTAISLDPGYFSQFFGQLVPSTIDVAVMLRADGVLLARSPRLASTDLALGPSSPFMAAIKTEPNHGLIEGRSSFDGVDRIVVYRKVGDRPLYVMGAIDRATIVAGWRDTLLRHLAFGVPATLGLIGLAWTALHRSKAEAASRQLLAERTRERDRAWTASHDLQAVLDQHGRFKAINPSFVACLGWTAESIATVKAAELIHPDDAGSSRTLLEGIRRPGMSAVELRCRHRDGSYRWIAWSLTIDDQLIYASGRDVTHQKEAAAKLAQTEAQLRQAQKMEAVGRLTGGVAHDFNNLLTAVTGNLDLARRRLSPEADPRALRNINQALEASGRAAQLTQRLLAFSRQTPLSPQPADINKLVAGMSDLLHRTLGEKIQVETVLAGGLWRADIDVNQLENAILNLGVNARDAMPQGGKLTIETANSYLDDSYVAQLSDVTAPGQYVLIAVSDNGTGMPESVRSKVFEPFFTTKPVGQGTGLGLAQVYGFVQQSRGHVAIYSEEGLGTTVKLYFPRWKGRERDEPDLKQPAEETLASAHGELILVVEDDPLVRDFSVTALEEAGYDVLSAADGPGGLTVLQKHSAEIALLFTDVVLTGPLNGREVADQARTLVPGLPVLFTTGYSRNAIVHQGRLDDGVELLPKPFTASALSSRVRTLLDRARST